MSEEKNLECTLLKNYADFQAGEDVILTLGQEGVDICGGGGAKKETVPYGEIQVLCLSEDPEFREEELFAAIPGDLGTSLADQLSADTSQLYSEQMMETFVPDASNYLFLIGYGSGGAHDWIRMQVANNLMGKDFVTALEDRTGAKVYHNEKKMDKKEGLN
ncbi:MAG: hypothetical protein LUC17_01440 [Oscillospiraceae bacterium]|nr:hypothetical protein [Oscillospiraceae bacterium]